MWSFKSSRKPTSEHQNKVSQAVESLFKREDLGFFKIARLKEAIKTCGEHQSFFESKTTLVVVGLGGSSLGAKAMYQGLCKEDNSLGRKLVFLDNVDAFTLDRFLAQMDDVSKVGWIVCSKSGSTLEVLALYDYCSQVLKEKHNFEIEKNTAVITEDKSSAVSDFAEKHSCPQMEIPMDIGGRFSVFTPVGLFPLSFLGVNLDEIQTGVEEALKNKEGLVHLCSALFESLQKQETNFYCFQYCDRLSEFSLWLQQLWSESLAKATCRDQGDAPSVSTFVPCRGASDQHSVLQQIIEGREKKFVGFHRVGRSEKGEVLIQKTQFNKSLMTGRHLGELLKVEAEATEQAIQESGSETFCLQTEDLNEKSLASLMTLWMLSIGVLGELLDINAFDQPGVESGKVIARRVLSQSD